MAVSAVNIRPAVSILSVLRHLNYRPWFALAEFVDNALQSYLDNQHKLQSLAPPAGPLIVRIDIEAGANRITIRDNAGGIEEASYERAFRPAAIPADSSGLSEFGMGMKSAACWFSPHWHVRTSALGEAVERTVRFDIHHIIKGDISELMVEERPADARAHFTEVVLDGLHRPPIGRTIGKIKEHLTDIFRVFLRCGVMELVVNGDSLAYTELRVLVAPHFRTPDAEPVEWRKDIKFDLGQGMSVEGFAAIRETASVSSAGFALFRRSRLIQGSAEEGYRPEHIFGKPNSYCYQRLFGELHLSGFEVAQTKDGIRWDENEQPFLELLLEHLDSDDMPLIRQANGYRARASRTAVQTAAKLAVDHTVQTLERTLEPVLEAVAGKAPEKAAPPEHLPEQRKLAERDFDIRFRDVNWRIIVELNDDPSVGEWLAIGDTGRPAGDGTPRLLRLSLSLAHPFMVRFSGADSSGIEPLLRAAAAIGLAEVLARESGIGQAGTIRRNVNDLLRDSLSQP